MERKDIVVYNDLKNLTNDDLEKLVAQANIEVNDEIDLRSYCYEMKNILYNDEITKSIIENKVFAGILSIKWYKIKFHDEENKEEVKRNLESEKVGFNTILNIDTQNLETSKIYTTINIGPGEYMMRVFVPSGYKTISNGYNTEKRRNINNVIAIIDINRLFLEIRTNFKDANKIKNVICAILKIDEVQEIDVLYKYNNDIEKFKDALFKGRFTETASIPDGNITLTREENEVLVNVLNSLDNYFINKDINSLCEELENIDIDMHTNDIPFTQLFLAGLAKIGISIVEDDTDKDLSNQSLYSILKPYIIHSMGYINFSIPEEPETKYTIQVGISTKSISFRSSVTEKVIDYIRDKII